MSHVEYLLFFLAVAFSIAIYLLRRCVAGILLSVSFLFFFVVRFIFIFHRVLVFGADGNVFGYILDVCLAMLYCFLFIQFTLDIKNERWSLSKLFPYLNILLYLLILIFILNPWYFSLPHKKMANEPKFSDIFVARG